MCAKRIDWNKSWKSLKKRALLDAVLHVFSEQGVQGLTMDNVALEAGVAKGTLYSYFENKEQLLKTAIDAGIAPLIDELTQLLESDLSPIEKLQNLTLQHLAYCDEHKNFFRILVHDRQAVQDRMQRYRNGPYNDFLQRTARVISAGIKDGSLRHANPLFVASMLIESNIAIIHRRLQSDHPGPVEKDAAAISNVFLFGIAEESLRKKRGSRVG
jgi:TetR/AcrR family transcriptional regulator